MLAETAIAATHIEAGENTKSAKREIRLRKRDSNPCPLPRRILGDTQFRANYSDAVNLEEQLRRIAPVQSAPSEKSLNIDQTDALRLFLRRAGVTAPQAAAILGRCIETSIAHYYSDTLKRRDAPTARQVHNRLREVWRLAERPDPPVGQIRALLKRLPAEVRAEIERRAERRWSVHFAEAAPPNFAPGWFAELPKEHLLALLPGAVSEGGVIAPGRGRGGGRRSKPHYEPIIRGVARGAPKSSQIATMKASGNTAASELGRQRGSAPRR